MTDSKRCIELHRANPRVYQQLVIEGHGPSITKIKVPTTEDKKKQTQINPLNPITI